MIIDRGRSILLHRDGIISVVRWNVGGINNLGYGNDGARTGVIGNGAESSVRVLVNGAIELGENTSFATGAANNEERAKIARLRLPRTICVNARVAD